jgi:hypothetical protein
MKNSPLLIIFLTISFFLSEIPSLVQAQGCLKYRCSSLSDNDITDAVDSIPFCVYKTEINPSQILIDSSICANSKSSKLQTNRFRVPPAPDKLQAYPIDHFIHLPACTFET